MVKIHLKYYVLHFSSKTINDANLCLFWVVVGICNQVDSNKLEQNLALVQMIHCVLKCI